MAIASISPHEVTKVWKKMIDYCKERDCYSKCEEDCNLKKARTYLRGFTKNGRDVNKGLEDVEFEKTDRSFDEQRVKEFLEQTEGLCEECGAYHVEKCFINRSRQALEMIVKGRITEFDPW